MARAAIDLLTGSIALIHKSIFTKADDNFFNDYMVTIDRIARQDGRSVEEQRYRLMIALITIKMVHFAVLYALFPLNMVVQLALYDYFSLFHLNRLVNLETMIMFSLQPYFYYLFLIKLRHSSLRYVFEMIIVHDERGFIFDSTYPIREKLLNVINFTRKLVVIFCKNIIENLVSQ